MIFIVFCFSSDGTLNPNGIRFGSAEIYSIVDQFNDEVVDSLCVAQRNPSTGDERVVLFLKVSSQKKKKTITKVCSFIRIRGCGVGRVCSYLDREMKETKKIFI